MMAKLLVFLALLVTLHLVEARYIRTSNVMERMEEEERRKSHRSIIEIDGISIDVLRNLTPNRFVPINNDIFFKSYEPCEEGLERDFLGVCREVWD